MPEGRQPGRHRVSDSRDNRVHSIDLAADLIALWFVPAMCKAPGVGGRQLQRMAWPQQPGCALAFRRLAPSRSADLLSKPAPNFPVGALLAAVVGHGASLMSPGTGIRRRPQVADSISCSKV